MGPEVAFIFDSFSLSGFTEWLAGVSGCEYVDGFAVVPFGVGYVAVVSEVGPALGEDFCGWVVVFVVPDCFGVEGFFCGQVESSDSCAE